MNDYQLKIGTFPTDGREVPKQRAVIQMLNIKSSSKNGQRTTIYTVKREVAKQNAGILSRAEDDAKLEISQSYEVRKQNLHTPTYSKDL